MLIDELNDAEDVILSDNDLNLLWNLVNTFYQPSRDQTTLSTTTPLGGNGGGDGVGGDSPSNTVDSPNVPRLFFNYNNNDHYKKNDIHRKNAFNPNLAQVLGINIQ